MSCVDSTSRRQSMLIARSEPKNQACREHACAVIEGSARYHGVAAGVFYKIDMSDWCWIS
jgi:hypothetical protein